MKSNAENMKKLRQKRKEENKCTRCGRKLDNTKTLCNTCLKYGKERRKNNKRLFSPEKINKVRKVGLLYAMQRQNTSTKQLAEAIGVTQRSVERWLYCGATPTSDKRRAINDFFNEEVYEVSLGKSS